MKKNYKNSVPLDIDIEFIIRSVPGYVYWKDLDSVYLGCNQNILLISGLNNLEDIIGKTDKDLPWGQLRPEIVEHNLKADRYVIETGQSIVTEEDIGIKNQNGLFIVIRSEKSPLRDKNGKIIGVLGISIDITAQKEAERLKLENEAQKLENQSQAKLLEQELSFKQFVGQMVHDIKSPLASLSGIINESGSAIPEDKRITMRQAAMRISDIAQHMQSRYKNKSDEHEIAHPVLASAAILEVLAEKRYEHIAVNFEINIKPAADFIFIRVEPGQFKRMISNLLNNAVEALDTKPDGKVELRLNANDEWLMITISDNGKGLSKEQIEKIQSDVSFTEGKKHGSGLGLTQVRETIRRNFGQFEINSTLGQRTSVLVKFPIIATPSWIAADIKIIKGDTIVILDDDLSIHGYWDTKFAPIIGKIPDLIIKHFTDGRKAVSFLNSLSTRQKNKVCLLTDYELLEQDIDGLEVIEQTKIKRSILVTSHYTNVEIRMEAMDLQVKILPKELASVVTINIDKKIKPRSKKIDMVWVDDARWFIDGWAHGYFKDCKIDAYSDPNVFLADVMQYPLDTIIILDHYYYDGEGLGKKFLGDGLEIAQILHKKGFTRLYMFTGEEIGQSVIPDYLTVFLKTEDEKIKQLLNLLFVS